MARPVRMYWWNGRDLADFFAEVGRRGSENVRIEFHVESGLLHVKHASHVSDAQAETIAMEGDDNHGEGYNFVFTCPPVCPNGDG